MNRFTKILVICLGIITSYYVFVIIYSCTRPEPENQNFAYQLSFTSSAPIPFWTSIRYNLKGLLFILAICILLFLKIFKKKNTNFISFILLAYFSLYQIKQGLYTDIFLADVLNRTIAEGLFAWHSILFFIVFFTVSVLLFTFMKELPKDEKIYFINPRKNQLLFPAFLVLAQFIPVFFFYLQLSDLLQIIINLAICLTPILITFLMIYQSKIVFLFIATITLAFVSFDNIMDLYMFSSYGSNISRLIDSFYLSHTLNAVFHLVSSILLIQIVRKHLNVLKLEEF